MATTLHSPQRSSAANVLRSGSGWDQGPNYHSIRAAKSTARHPPHDTALALTDPPAPRHTQTAGSVCLLVQVALPCALFTPGPVRLTLRGGTNASMAPQVDYCQHVLLPLLHTMGAEAELDIVRRGYFPRGGGEVLLETKPVKEKLRPIYHTVPGPVTRVGGIAYVSSKLPLKVAQGAARAAEAELRTSLPKDAEVSIDVVAEPPARGEGAGCGIVLYAETAQGCRFGGSALGERGVPAATVGKNAARELLLLIRSASTVDSHLLDQLVIFMALAVGRKAAERHGQEAGVARPSPSLWFPLFSPPFPFFPRMEPRASRRTSSHSTRRRPSSWPPS